MHTDNLANLGENEFPLKILTTREWVEHVHKDINSLLIDHAHLEKKAAQNALELLARWPEGADAEKWCRVLSAIAQDECSHLLLVCKLLEKRGVVMTRSHRNPYATSLRGLVRKGDATGNLVDRLLVSALIELRSCERFYLLGEHCQDPPLKKMYLNLFASESGHYKVFLSLAKSVDRTPNVVRRFEELLTSEAEILLSQEKGARIHSWI
ncbi:MAG: hypothetical protein KDD53_05455 [Bdellovibrionales bacterium]|nr:hypothetical protein [Bdellovibrionales bacterium]